MKLTIDKVRALRDYHREELCTRHRAAIPVECSLCGRHAIGVALAEEWIAARTVRWDGDTLHGPTFCGEVAGWNGAGYCAHVYGSDGIAVDRSTEADASAWLEEQAREAGLEVAT